MYSPNSSGADPPAGDPREGGIPVTAASIPAVPMPAATLPLLNRITGPETARNEWPSLPKPRRPGGTCWLPLGGAVILSAHGSA